MTGPTAGAVTGPAGAMPGPAAGAVTGAAADAMTGIPLVRPDRITLTGVEAIGRHGVFEHEKRDGQPFVVDAVLYTDIRPAAATDDLTRTLHYGEVAQEITALITGEPFDLIETLAQKIADAILARFSPAAVEITVHKPKAPIPVPFGDVTITIYRER